MATTNTVRAKPRKERKANADKRRRQLIDATLRSIVANGLARTTLATVSDEAGLSQGVAVFYFKTKQGLFTEALRAQYDEYFENWQSELDATGDDPVDRLVALVSADFSPSICNPDALAIWYAFWGEAKTRPLYAEIAKSFEEPRVSVVFEICRALLPKATAKDISMIAIGIDALSDGLWQRMHLTPDLMDAKMAIGIMTGMLKTTFPKHSEAIAMGLARHSRRKPGRRKSA